MRKILKGGKPMTAICMQCGKPYSVSIHRNPNNTFICADCAEKNRSKVCHEKPKGLIYRHNGMARVACNGVSA